jgi:pimeloyl-ACP methyl ester carboxylesterase
MAGGWPRPTRAGVPRASARSEIIPGAGHDFTLVAPGLVADRVLSFLEEALPAERQRPASPANVALPA